MNSSRKRSWPDGTLVRVLLPLLLLLCAEASADATAKADLIPEIRLVTSQLLPYAIEEGAQPGFMVELVEEIERRLGSERPITFLPWPRSQRLARQGANHIIFPLTRNPAREDHYTWLIKAAPIEMVFVTLEGEPLSLVRARALDWVSVQQDTPFEQFLKHEGFDNLVSIPDSGPLHVRLLRVKRTQAWFTAKDLAAYAWREQRIEEPMVLSDSVYRSHVYIATSKQFPPRVASAYRRTFEAIVADGTLDAIMARYQR